MRDLAPTERPMSERLANGLDVIAQDLRSPDPAVRERAIGYVEAMAFGFRYGRQPNTPCRRSTDKQEPTHDRSH